MYNSLQLLIYWMNIIVLQLEISNSDMLQISTEDSIQHYHGIVTQNTVIWHGFVKRHCGILARLSHFTFVLLVVGSIS